MMGEDMMEIQRPTFSQENTIPASICMQYNLFFVGGRDRRSDVLLLLFFFFLSGKNQIPPNHLIYILITCFFKIKNICMFE